MFKQGMETAVSGLCDALAGRQGKVFGQVSSCVRNLEVTANSIKRARFNSSACSSKNTSVALRKCLM